MGYMEAVPIIETSRFAVHKSMNWCLVYMKGTSTFKELLPKSFTRNISLALAKKRHFFLWNTKRKNRYKIMQISFSILIFFTIQVSFTYLVSLNFLIFTTKNKKIKSSKNSLVRFSSFDCC